MTESRNPLHPRIMLAAMVAACLIASGCVYQPDIQQGNFLDQEKVEQVAVGMTRSQVEFLLGTPMISDPFHQQRWDYPYYLRRGRSDNIQRRWLVVHFENDRVSLVELDRTLDQT
jgi:outer membrane protein assembly factor BamE